MAIDFSGLTYVSTDKKYVVDLASLHINTWLNAFQKAADHVFGNEAIAAVSTAKSKNGGEIADDVAESIKLEKRNKSLADMQTGGWGEKGTRAPRIPGQSRLDVIRNNFLADDTRKAIARKPGLTAGEAKDTWVTTSGKVVTLEQFMGLYMKDPVKGEERMANIELRAQNKYRAELADAEARKAAKELEAKATVAADGDELAL